MIFLQTRQNFEVSCLLSLELSLLIKDGNLGEDWSNQRRNGKDLKEQEDWISSWSVKSKTS